MDKVSVIIGTYERFEMCLRAVNSVLDQTYDNIEIIVVDDASQDPQYEYFKTLDNVKYIKRDKRSGLPAVPRNVGIKESTGQWIAFLDDDDYFLPNKIEKQMSFTSEYEFICTEAFANDPNGLKYSKGFYLDWWNIKNPSDTNNLDIVLLSGHNLIINSSVLVKKQLLENINYITEELEWKRREDYNTWLKLLESQTKYCYFIEEPLLVYTMDSYKHDN